MKGSHLLSKLEKKPSSDKKEAPQKEGDPVISSKIMKMKVMIWINKTNLVHAKGCSNQYVSISTSK